MTKQEMIIELMNLYDEIDVLKNENERLAAIVSNVSKGNEERVLKPIDYLMIEQGKKQIFKNAIYSWEQIETYYDEKTDTYSVDNYAEWLSKKIKKGCIPDEISLDEFRNYFRKELIQLYEEEKTKALNEAKGITERE